MAVLQSEYLEREEIVLFPLEGSLANSLPPEEGATVEQGQRDHVWLNSDLEPVSLDRNGFFATNCSWHTKGYGLQRF